MILNYLRIFGHSIHRNALTVCSTRKLFTKEFLRVTEFESQRLENLKFSQPDTVLETIEFQLRAKNEEEVIKNFKRWIHVIDRSQCKEHFPFLMECLLFIRDNPPKNFNFGPVVMRMLHSLNMPHEAINIAHNFETADIFDEATSPIILCDLLFNNAMYNEVLRVVQRKKAMNEKRDMKTTRLLNCITFATCYKLNTQDHLSFALEIWNKSVKEHQLSQAINFLCLNAVNLDQAKITLDILPAHDFNFAAFCNRLLVLSDCGKYAEATQVIRSYQDKYPHMRIPKSVANRMRENLNKYDQTVDANNFYNLLNDLKSSHKNYY